MLINFHVERQGKLSENYFDLRNIIVVSMAGLNKRLNQFLIDGIIMGDLYFIVKFGTRSTVNKR
jgi:hypothetical protein